MSTRDTDTYEIGTDETGSLCVIFAKWSREMEQHQTRKSFSEVWREHESQSDLEQLRK